MDRLKTCTEQYQHKFDEQPITIESSDEGLIESSSTEPESSDTSTESSSDIAIESSSDTMEESSSSEEFTDVNPPLTTDDGDNQ